MGESNSPKYFKQYFKLQSLESKEYARISALFHTQPRRIRYLGNGMHHTLKISEIVPISNILCANIYQDNVTEHLKFNHDLYKENTVEPF